MIQCDFSVLDNSQNRLITDSLKHHLSKLESSFRGEKFLFILTNILISGKSLIPPKTLLQKINETKQCIAMVPKLSTSKKSEILTLLYNNKLAQSISEILKHVKFTTTNEIIITNRSQA